MNDMSSSRRIPGLDLPGGAWGLPRELDDLLDRFGRWAGWDVGGRAQPAHWMPIAEEDETADAYRVRLELPGIPRDRVRVEIEGRQLCVRGDLGETTTQQDSYLTHRSGSFLYRTSLPADADSDTVRADLRDGVLTVLVPRSSSAGRRSVPIGGAAGEGEVIAGQTIGASGSGGDVGTGTGAGGTRAGTGAPGTDASGTADDSRIAGPPMGQQVDGT
ncbi:Hsp20/alpha crystallin family protein [Catenulispora subtropica]|uniref:SHSP domain-containing protein n=1 Tax=Catenulispora subtropica TaxID=450798 RepID=A0ABP5ELS1_9ACTN